MTSKYTRELLMEAGYTDPDKCKHKLAFHRINIRKGNRVQCPKCLSEGKVKRVIIEW